MIGSIKKEEMYDKLGNIDQIRDIIFGAHLREYNNRFEKLENDLTLIHQEMRDRLMQLKAELAGELRAAIDTLEKKYKTLQTTSEEERLELKQQVERTHRKAQSNFEKLSTDLEEIATALRNDLAQSKASFTEDVRSLRTYVQEEFDRRLSALGDLKVSRDDMAEILFELGMRLKGTEFVPELEEATDLILVDRLTGEE